MDAASPLWAVAQLLRQESGAVNRHVSALPLLVFPSVLPAAVAATLLCRVLSCFVFFWSWGGRMALTAARRQSKG
jgi:hypothetical protein